MNLASVLRHSKRLAPVLSSSFVTSAQAASLRESIGSHKVLALVVVALAAAAAAAWLVSRKRYWQLAALAAVALVAATFYGRSKFLVRYPHAALSIERLKDSAAILLGTDMRLTRFDPRSMLVVEHKTVERAMYPAIDVHFHLESLPPNITPERLIRAMDATNVAKLINMGGTQEMFDHFATTYHDRYPDRFVMFMKPDFDAVAKPGGVAAQVQWIDDAARKGAVGIGEINKSFGTAFRDPEGNLLKVDDPRLDPIWDEAGRLGLPVLIHTGDPPAFFLPVDEHNERYEELSEFPEWGRSNPGDPTFAQLMTDREQLIAKHPRTIFIGAHIGSNEDDLAYASHLLDKYPNYYVDMAARVAALGREPYTARRFLIKYQDRVLFATDGGFGMADTEPGWTAERYFRSHFEFLETANEYIEYPQWPLSQGRWRVYGVDLPPEVLEKIYAGNIERLLPTHEAILARLAGGSSAAPPP
jgi:predicted TIM-barrel fold metal-dependent hydrolase